MTNSDFNNFRLAFFPNYHTVVNSCSKTMQMKSMYWLQLLSEAAGIWCGLISLFNWFEVWVNRHSHALVSRRWDCHLRTVGLPSRAEAGTICSEWSSSSSTFCFASAVQERIHCLHLTYKNQIRFVFLIHLCIGIPIKWLMHHLSVLIIFKQTKNKQLPSCLYLLSETKATHLVGNVAPRCPTVVTTATTNSC